MEQEYFDKGCGLGERGKACGFSADMHFVGAWNIAARWWTKNVGGDVSPEWHQMQPMAERLVATEKPSVEAQRSP